MQSPLKQAGIALLAVALMPAAALAAGGGKPEGAMVFVADSRRFTGWRAWCTNLYNESLFEFTLLTIIAIPVTAVVLGTVTSYLLGKTGINLKNRAVAEH